MGAEPVRPLDSIKFGDDFELDLRTFALRRAGRRLKLERIPTEILLLLIEQKEQIVSREQIVARVWGNGAFLDTDNSINGAIRKIRQVLKDDPEHPRFVQTITGRGYRFIAPVIDPELEAPAAPQLLPALIQDPDPISKPVTRRWPVFLGICICLIVALGVWYQWSHSRSRLHPSGERFMLAVLPFENLTGEPGQDYFSDGLTEEMISQLGNLDPQHLGVIARTSVMHYKHSPEPLDRVGRELGVQYVLEGSVRRDSGKVRITAQLIQVKDQSHLWARQYDRELSGLLSLQGEIAGEIADEIQLTLDDHSRADPAKQPPLSPQALEAYDLYLNGRYCWNKRTAQGFHEAVSYFQQAIAKDPNYARAYAGLADTYSLMSGYNIALPREVMPKARAAALRALEIDEKLPEAHTSLALIAENYDWDWQTSEKEYRRAIQLDPNYATAHQWYAEFLSYQGRFDEAFAESERARQLDPLSLIIDADNAAILYFSRQYDRAIQQFRTVLEMEPHFGRAHMMDYAYVEKGMYSEALADLEQWRRVEDQSAWTLMMQAYVLGRAGNQVKAQRALEQLLQLNRRETMDPAPVLYAYIGAGNKEQAFVWLEKAYAEHSTALTTLKVNPMYDPLRGDPRFLNLMRRVGLAP